jgi:hypothetical protein
MAKTFNIAFTGDAAALLNRARAIAVSNGAQISGDSSRGSFSGKGIIGNYSVSGNTVSVTISDKPALIPWGIVESQLRSFFQ